MRTTSKIPKRCPVCGQNNWKKSRQLPVNDKKKGRIMIALAWKCGGCGFEREGKTNDGITIPITHKKRFRDRKVRVPYTEPAK